LTTAALAFLIAIEAGRMHSLPLLLLAALALDAAVQVCQVLSLRSIYMLAPEIRGRLNGLYMAFVFVCGAVGSALAAAVYVFCGWGALATLGALFVAAALARYLAEFGAEIGGPVSSAKEVRSIIPRVPFERGGQRLR
jgi:MFS family permease